MDFDMKTLETDRNDESNILGITGGGQTLNVAKKSFQKFLQLIVDIAKLQASYVAIDEALKITNRRVNALEHIVIPRILYVISYIKLELEERATQDKFTIKKILQVKAKHKEKEEKLASIAAGKEEEPSALDTYGEKEDDDKLF